MLVIWHNPWYNLRTYGGPASTFCHSDTGSYSKDQGYIFHYDQCWQGFLLLKIKKNILEEKDKNTFTGVFCWMYYLMCHLILLFYYIYMTCDVD